MISIDEALSRILSNLPPRRVERVGLPDCLGRVLAEDLAATTDIPPFSRSAMDGYALRAEDVANTPARLRLAGEVRAGGGDPGAIKAGQAKAIMTGAPIPEGADAVQTVEESQTSADGREVVILKPVQKGENIRPRGAETARGGVVLEAGRYIGPPEVAVLATFGFPDIPVWGKPRVALIATGDEIVEAGETPRPDQIRNSNAPSVSAQLRYMGLESDYLGIAADTKEALRLLIGEGLKRDVLIITGGVSVGEYDFVKDVFEEFGLQIIFSKVAVRPGKPMVFARQGDRLVFGLPGNPVSTCVTFEIFVRPALGRLCGHLKPELPRVRGVLLRAVRQRRGRTSFVPAWAEEKPDRWEIDPVQWQGSGDIIGFARANAVFIFPRERDFMASGEGVEALLLPDYSKRNRFDR